MASMNLRRLALALALAMLVGSGAALTAAQQLCDAGRSALGQTTRAVEKLDRELGCLRDKRDRLARLLVLLSQAEAQAHSGTLSAREREDGEASVAALRVQAAGLERESQRCVEPELVFAASDGAPAP